MRIHFPHLLLAGLSLATTLAATNAAPPAIIFDTDYRSDCDDVSALAMLHALEDMGKVTLLGAIATTTGRHVVGAIDAVNTRYGRPDLPIGVITREKGLNTTLNSDDFAGTLANPKSFVSDQTNATAPNATALYRRLLHQASDRGVTILVVGGQTAIHRLLTSGADHDGDGIARTGHELVAAKVSELVIMGGHFTNPRFTEFNIRLDLKAARHVAGHWPGRITYTGFEIGEKILTGAALTDPETNPVARAYKRHRGTTGGAGVIGDRKSWDQTAVLIAAVGDDWNGRKLWEISPSHAIDFDDIGRAIVTPSATVNRHFITQSDNLMTHAEIASIISDLMTATPRTPGPRPGTAAPANLR
ncbi:MAG: nucleoside hydrolase [Verrucomicrobiota bacterium]